MSKAPRSPSKEAVLDAFAVEADPGRGTLERYLLAYPQFAEELVDLSQSIHRTVPSGGASLDDDDEEMIKAAWVRHVAAGAAADPLGRLSTDELRSIAQRLEVPRQVIVAFQEHRVAISTVPKRFLRQLADSARATVEDLVQALSAPHPQPLARSFRANQPPQSEGQVAFERLLSDAGLSDLDRKRLMSETD